APDGGLMYDASLSGTIGAADTDSFTIYLLAGQVLTVVADPAAGLQPSLEMRNPSDVLIASATALSVGKDAVLQTVAAQTTGTYKISLFGAASTGAYTVKLTLNGATELESHDGATNDAVGSAQNLNGAFTGIVGLPGPAIAGVQGRTDPLVNPPLPNEVEPN